MAATALAANSTKLSINCTPNSLSPGVPAACTVTVTDSGPAASRVPPQGSVALTLQSGIGTLDPDGGCDLEASGAFSSNCSLTYTPTAIDGGTHELLGVYGGDDGHGRATGQFILQVAPPNDAVENAVRLSVPATATGTTEGATYADSDPELCGDADSPVWYSITPRSSGRLAVTLAVHRRIGGIVAVFEERGSTLQDLGCDQTSSAETAGVPFDAVRGVTYLIAVASPYDAESGSFVIKTSVVPPLVFPGQLLRRSANVTLDPLLRPGIVFSLRLRAGVSYRIEASAESSCLHVAVLRRGASSLDDVSAVSNGCTGYLLFTPNLGMSGVFPLVVTLEEGASTAVHVEVRRAAPDDLAPGIPLVNGKPRVGHLSARAADAVDVYRFRVATRSDARVVFHGAVPADVVFLNEHGKQLLCACGGLKKASLSDRLDPGVYFVAVRSRSDASGTYGLSLRVRRPTRATIALSANPGGRHQLDVLGQVSPRIGRGRVVFELEEFDPLTLWHFVSSSPRLAKGGKAELSFTPGQGGWRLRVRYLGSSTSSPSVSPWLDYLVGPGTSRPAHPTTHPPVCGPGSSVMLLRGPLTVSCTPKGFSVPAAAHHGAASIPTQISRLRALIAGLTTLKEPFKGDLEADLDAAGTAFFFGRSGEASARLQDFVAELSQAPLQAQLAAEQLKQLTADAQGIRTALGSGSSG
jgi:hypothetical protein